MTATATAAAMLVACAPAEAIVGGQVNDEAYPAVGAVIRGEPGGIIYPCSGTLIAPRKLLTAGHCVATANWLKVNFGSRPPIDPDTWLPQGPGWIDVVSVDLHPSRNGSLFDIAVADLASAPPGVEPMPLAGSATVEGMTLTERRDATWTAVGFGGYFTTGQPGGGLEVRGRGAQYQLPLTRGVTTLEYIRATQEDNPAPDALGWSQLPEMLLTQNSADLGHDENPGSICYGDSGGPLILDGRIVAELSGPFTGAPCRGGFTYYQRTDTPGARSFLAQHLTLP